VTAIRTHAFVFLLAGAVLASTACTKAADKKKAATCQTTADCAGGLVCTIPDGGDGTCQPCELDNQCALDEICHPIDRRCELRHCFSRDCKLNADCKLGDFCVQGRCLDPRMSDADGCTVTTCVQPVDCVDPLDRCDTTNNVCVLNLGCTSDDQCPTGEKCNIAANVCQSACTPETAADVCGVRQQCSDGRCVDCLSTADCGLGLTCNVTTNLCVGSNSCVSSRDCMIPKVCHPITKQCTENPGPCKSDVDCAADQTCDIKSGFCVPRVCQADAFEPNNTFETAKPLNTGATTNLTLCSQQADYFAIALVNGDHVDIVVDTPNGPLMPFDLALFDDSKAMITETTNFALDAVISVPGTYVLRAQSTDTYVQYGLRVSITRGVPCPTGPGSPSATYLDARATTSAGETGVSLCPGDKDWFQISVPRSQRLTVELDTTVLAGALDLYLYDSDGMTLLDSNLDLVDTKTVTSNAFTGTAPKAYIKVSASPGTQNVYDLKLTVGP
jgi:hypothetical protein